jgi:hypothetical protein
MKKALVAILLLFATYVHADSGNSEAIHIKHEVASKYLKCLARNFIYPGSPESEACIKEIDKFILQAAKGNRAVYEQLEVCISKTPIHQRSSEFNTNFRKKLNLATQLAAIEKM